MTRSGLLAIIAAIFLAACGGSSWTEADSKSASNAVRAQILVEAACAGDAGCPPGQVRALERMALCSNLSMLSRHGHPLDGGVSCRP
jgi:hypothetical protein